VEADPEAESQTGGITGWHGHCTSRKASALLPGCAKEFAPVTRLRGVTIPVPDRWLVARHISVLAVYAVARPSTVTVLELTIAFFVYRLLAERARRCTVMAVLERAPSGSTVLLESTPSGPEIWITVGARRDQLLSGG
jgi:hypothetical protein